MEKVSSVSCASGCESLNRSLRYGIIASNEGGRGLGRVCRVTDADFICAVQ